MILLDKGRFLVEFEPEAEMVIETIRDVDGVMLTETERWYVNFIVSGLKGIGVWGKMKALYGFVGATAASHKWNWKDMRDSDEAFRLSFLGCGWIHSSTGAKPNGTTSYADTFLNPSLKLEVGNTSMGFYTKSNSYTDNGVDMGVLGYSAETMSLSSYLSGLYLSTAYNESTSVIAPTAMFINQPTFALQNVRDFIHTFYVNCIKFGNNPSANVLPNETIWISNYNTLAVPSRPLVFHSAHEVGFAFIGEGLTELEAIQMSHIITTAQGILGRKS